MSKDRAVFPLAATDVAPPPPHAEGFAVLSRHQCLESIAAGGVGRVAVNRGGVPAVFPVRYALAGEDLVFSALVPGADDAIDGDTVVAVEADSVDPAAGWSVVVSGVARPTDGGAFRVGTAAVSGRRLLRQQILVGGAVRDPFVSHRHAQADDGGRGRALSARGGVEVLSTEECLRLLAGEEVGRLAVLVGDAPHLFPVNYALDDDAVVFRTAPGTKLEAVSRSLAAFEVDRLSPASPAAWSVVVEGIAQEVTSADAPGVRERLAVLPLHPWAAGDRHHFVRILATSITGIRLSPAGKGAAR